MYLKAAILFRCLIHCNPRGSHVREQATVLIPIAVNMVTSYASEFKLIKLAQVPSINYTCYTRFRFNIGTACMLVLNIDCSAPLSRPLLTNILAQELASTKYFK